jgi:hypothetical protein
MDAPHVYEIRVEGHLADRWSDWFEGLTIRNDPDGEVILTGPLTDQAALFGVLTKIHDLNLVLISVRRRPAANEHDITLSLEPCQY